jgi:hypothetical protein
MQIEEDLKPGSGKIWKNQLTRPVVPKITGLVSPYEMEGDSNELHIRSQDDQFFEPMIINKN